MAQLKLRGEEGDAEGHAAGLEHRIKAGCEIGGSAVQPHLQRRALLLHIGQAGMGRRHGERVAAEGAAKEGHGDAGAAIIAELPWATIDRIEEAGMAGDDADRHAATDHLAIGHDVGLHAEMGLRPPGVNAESVDQLVEDQGYTVPVADPA